MNHVVNELHSLEMAFYLILTKTYRCHCFEHLRFCSLMRHDLEKIKNTLEIPLIVSPLFYTTQFSVRDTHKIFMMYINYSFI